jgi:Flp pilus assembly protein TadD
MALSGHDASAESVFVSLLSRPPGKAPAYNNLGNLYLWRGQPEIALELYHAATEVDTADAGIRLNCATALMIAGDEMAARAAAEEGVRRAGGIEEAARLLGLRYEPPDEMPSKAAERARMSREEALMLLRAAASALPPDSIARSSPPADSLGTAARKRRVWRPAGARGSEAAEGAAFVYWKR